jgi:hypothetical protein
MGKHYVPKFYLRGFARADRFVVFDKESQRWFPSQPKSVANEVDLWPDELEAFVTGNIEDPAKGVIDRLRNRQSVTDEERYRLARYISFLWKRVPAGRSRVLDHTPAYADEIMNELNVGFDQLIREDKSVTGLAERRRAEIGAYIERIKIDRPPSIWHGSLQIENENKVTKGIAEMNWTVLHTTGARYLASDNPVFFFENDGIGNITSELTLPLSSDAALIGIRVGGRLPLHSWATGSQVREVNRRTASNASRYLFAESIEPWMCAFVLKAHHELTRRKFHPTR